MNTTVSNAEMNIDLTRFDRPVQTGKQSRPATRKPARTQFTEVPDGTYDVRIEDVELYTSPSSGNPVLKYTLRILGPEHANRIMWKRRAITDKTRSYVVDELRICGLEDLKFASLAQQLPDLIGVELEVSRKTNGENTNIYFKKQCGDTRAASSVEEDDEIPFF